MRSLVVEFILGPQMIDGLRDDAMLTQRALGILHAAVGVFNVLHVDVFLNAFPMENVRAGQLLCVLLDVFETKRARFNFIHIHRL